MRFALIHSPLVGPGTWAPVTRELETRGYHVIVPSLLGVADAPAPQWRHCVEAGRGATQDTEAPLVLVGHSGAGLLLPAIADAVPNHITGLVFADAFLPPTTGSTELLPRALLEQLRPLATEGVLPPWSTWFGEQGLRDLIPDARLRAALEREMPRLPLAYFETRVPQPAGWESRWRSGYLLFASDPYRHCAAEARERGWPVVELRDTHHLALVTEPRAVTTALLDITAELQARQSS
jgi:pimeloyl-ACP methyl ester carboxylesterase